MQNQKILYSHGKKILIKTSEKIAQTKRALARLADIFSALSFGLSTSHTGSTIINSGHCLFGQSYLATNTDNPHI